MAAPIDLALEVINELSPEAVEILHTALQGTDSYTVNQLAIQQLEKAGYKVLEYGTWPNKYYDIYRTATVQAGNGAATQLTVRSTAAIQNVVEAEGTVTADVVAEGTGTGLLAADVGMVGAIAAPFLGIAAGVNLYEKYPNIWNGIASALQGEGFNLDDNTNYFTDLLNINSDGSTSMDSRALEVIKNQFINAGIFESETYSEITSTTVEIPGYPKVQVFTNFEEVPLGYYDNDKKIIKYYKVRNNLDTIYMIPRKNGSWVTFDLFSKRNFEYSPARTNYEPWWNASVYTSSSGSVWMASTNPIDCSDNKLLVSWLSLSFPLEDGTTNLNMNQYGAILYGNIETESDNLEPGAKYPASGQTIPETYPDLQSKTIVSPNGDTIAEQYPVSIPDGNTDQKQSQTGENPSDEQQDKLYDLLYDLLDDDTEKEDETKPDPDPQPEIEPDPQPNPKPTVPDNPIVPENNPDPSDTPIIPFVPETVKADSLFCVYNPTASQLDSLGSFLWEENIVTSLLKMWQDPLDGIISLRKVYANPVTSGTHNIILGYIDSGVNSKVVSSQFTTIVCGTVEVKEVNKNATDYSPYTSLHLYLPFIGIVELDPDEFMNGTMTVAYHVDVYTGTCLAEVKCTRNRDMPSQQILYTFTGNASQEIPLTASNMNGAISSLVSLGAAGIGVASGGALGAVAGASLVGHSISHEMVHINRSGAISSNAGILGSRTPFLIIGRRNAFDANGYNSLYGYPTNKTVYLGNCQGFVRVKAGRLQSAATEAEKKEIMDLLQKGVIL